MIQDMTYLLATAHQADLRREADRARLASLAACCHPTSLLARWRGAGRCSD